MHTPEKTLNYLKEHHLDDRLEESDVSFHHVEDAYKFNLKSDQVAKSLLFYDNSKANGELAAVMVVMSGDSKISTGEFKRRFGYKTSMCSYDDVVSLTGYKPGGVCPFGIDNPNVKIFLDISLKKWDIVCPACGSEFSRIRLSPQELENSLPGTEWVDITKKEQ